jgi:hypothetical protein
MTETTASAPRVVVGIDGSPGAAHALREAAHEALIRHAELDVIHVWAPPVVGSTVGGFAIPIDSDEYRKAHGKLLDDAVDDLMKQADIRPELVERHLVQDCSVAGASSPPPKAPTFSWSATAAVAASPASCSAPSASSACTTPPAPSSSSPTRPEARRRKP